MGEKTNIITRRDFIKGASCAALGAAMGVTLEAVVPAETEKMTRVVLVRCKEALDENGRCSAEAMQKMMDKAVTALFDTEKTADAWQKMIKPDDIVGIKSNVWGPLPTPPELEQVIKKEVMGVGVKEKDISIGDRGILHDDVFKRATALINVRPMRTHHWSGVGSLLKNYIMFVEEPWQYHGNSCADLARLWRLPLVNGKTRLNILVMLTPLFHGIGAHHFDKTYTWPYKGILVGTDPVAVDAVGLEIMRARRKEFFGDNRPLKPSPHHIALADTKHKLGVADLNKIELVKIGFMEGSLI